MKTNYLVTVTDQNIIKDLKNLGVKLVFPLSFFCVGFPKTFSLNEITEENSYIYINRILDSKSINKLKKELENLSSNIKGIIFDDIGIIEIIKDKQVEKILYNTHFTTNYRSINYYFDYVDDIIISPDITEKEIDEIIKNTKKDISLFIFGLVPSMYSRRTLLTSFSKHNNVEYENIKEIHENNEKFITIENEFGTYIYHYPYYNASRLLKKKCHYYFYNPVFLEKEKILEILNNNFNNIDFDEGFLDKETIYKIKDL